MREALACLAVAAVAAGAPLAAECVRPAGIYGVVAVNDPADQPDLRPILDNPAISGVALRERWENLEPREGDLHLERIDRAIALAAERHKTVQLILVPGFFAPAWVMSRIPSCDARLDATCGKAAFAVPYGPAHGATRELPLPWNPVYKQAWESLLRRIAARYDPVATVVSIAVAGPTSVSAEMSMPARGDADLATWRRLLSLFDPSAIREHAENRLLIAEWRSAIDLYGQAPSRRPHADGSATQRPGRLLRPDAVGRPLRGTGPSRSTTCRSTATTSCTRTPTPTSRRN